MKIQNLNVSNFLGIGAVHLKPTAPVVIVAGPNAAGKTSLYQAIRLAFLGDIPRIDLMRDSSSLVRGGAERGIVQVQALNGAGEPGVVSVSLPDRKRSGEEPIEALRWSLEPHAFSNLEPKDRIRTVLHLTKSRMQKEAIVERLLARGIAPNVIDELRPQLVLGFEACAEIAKQKAAESRGAWKAATGEVYGSKKAAFWKAPTADLPDQPMSMDDAIAKSDAAAQEYANLTARAATSARLAEARARDLAAAPKAKGLRDRIEILKIEAGTPEEPEVAAAHEIPCPHCGAMLWIAEDLTVHKEAPPKPKVKKMTAAQRAKIKSELALAEKELVAAEGAAARLADPQPTPEPPLDETIEQARQARDDAADVLRSLRAQWDTWTAAKNAREQNIHKEALAQGAHLAVQAWEAAEEALSPGGIPLELMGAALAPLRTALRQVCASEAVSTWPLPEISDDGAIRAWGRPYALLSRSEQYRIDLVLAAALSVVSGTRILAADEADILEPHARGDLVNWLLDLTDNGALESAWIFLTLKGPPASIEGTEGYWIVDGSNASTTAATF